MIPENIQNRYCVFDNPYRKLFQNESAVIACDFNDYIPAWFLEYSSNGYPIELINQCIEIAESLKYYSFYVVINKQDYQSYLDSMSSIHERYNHSIEEDVPANDRPSFIMHRDWIFGSFVRQQDSLVILHRLKSVLQPSPFVTQA